MSSWFKKKLKGASSDSNIENESKENLKVNGVANGSAGQHADTARSVHDSHKIKELEELEEALESIASDPPVVARSIPRGLHLERSALHHRSIEQQQERAMRHCIFAPEVYDHMLADSMNACAMLQDNLDNCITNIRQNTPAASTPSPPLPADGQNGDVAGAATKPGDRQVPEKPSPTKKKSWLGSLGSKNKNQTVTFAKD